jgi:hypothetical protein
LPLIVALVAGMATFTCYGIVGLCTGVLGICSVASPEWESRFERAIVIIPIAAGLGLVVGSFVAAARRAD